MRTLRHLFAASLACAGVALPAIATAQPVQQCPPGSWFCEGAQGQGQVQVQQQPLQPLPGSQPAPVVVQGAPPPPVVVQGAPPPPVVVYQPAPPPVVIVERPAPRPPPPATYVYAARRAYRPEWGANLRLEGAMFGTVNGDVAGIGGLGLGLRFRPSPWFALEGDVDFLGGRDYNDYRRGETAFSLNALLFVNPRDRVQLYFLGGLGGSIAHVTDDANAVSHDWGYFGGQLGGGLEFRLWRHFALHADVRGFMRGRTDSLARTEPEFVDAATGRTTNTSGGMLVTGGLTFYF